MPTAQAVVGHASGHAEAVAEIDNVPAVAECPSGRNRIPFPEHAVAGGALPLTLARKDEQLLASVVECRSGSGIAGVRLGVVEIRYDRAWGGCAVGPGRGRAIPLPDRGAVVASCHGEEQQLAAARIGHHLRGPKVIRVAVVGTRCGKELGPLACAALPFPGVVKALGGVAKGQHRRAAGEDDE